MDILTYPLNGVAYDAEDAEVYLCTRTSGVFSSEGHFGASVTGTREVTIGAGLAWMQNAEYHGKAVYSPEDVALEIGEADAYQARIDRIVLQFDRQMQMTTLKVKEGTPSGSPSPPEVQRDADIYELGLYTVAVGASTVSVRESDIECTFLDEAVCGIMEDAVTGIPTQDLYDQWHGWFEGVTEDTAQFEEQLTIWFEDFREQAEGYFDEITEEGGQCIRENQDRFDEWFANLEYVLDGDVAGHLEVEVEKAQETADDAVGMLMTGEAVGRLADGRGNLVMADEDYAIALNWKICSCGINSIADQVYPVGSIYMSVSSANPGLLFGGTWTQLEDCFLLAAGSSYGAGDTGGEATVTLTTAQMPGHTHTGPSHTHSLPSHTHSIPALSGTAASAGAHTHDIIGTSKAVASGSNYFRIYYYGEDLTSCTASAGAHTHTVTTTASTTGSTSGTSGSSGTGATGSTGGGEAHNNMPPYLAVYMWQRVA